MLPGCAAAAAWTSLWAASKKQDSKVDKMASNNKPAWLTGRMVRTVVVTPRDAEWVLQNANPDNRALNQRRVDQWIAQMTDGKWAYNGASIVFDENNQLVDGQHRLAACWQSGKAFETVVVTGVAGERGRETTDVGKPRSYGDILRMRGFKDGVVLAATVRALYRIEESWGVTHRGDIRDPGTVVEMAAELGQTVRDAMEATKSIPAKWIGRGSSSALWILFARSSSPKQASEFWEGVATGAALAPDDVRLALRNRLQADASVMMGQGRVIATTATKEIITIRSWNRWIENMPAIQRNGRAVTVLTKADKLENASHPEARGRLSL